MSKRCASMLFQIEMVCWFWDLSAMNQLLPSQLKSPDSFSQYPRAIQKYEVTHLRLCCGRCLHALTLRATRSFVPHLWWSHPKEPPPQTSAPRATWLWLPGSWWGKYTDRRGLSVASQVETARGDRNDTALAPWELPCSTETCISEKGMLHWTGDIYLNPGKKKNCLRHVYFCFVADRRHWQTLALRSSLES